jgi:hypothetical protein
LLALSAAEYLQRDYSHATASLELSASGAGGSSRRRWEQWMREQPNRPQMATAQKLIQLLRAMPGPLRQMQGAGIPAIGAIGKLNRIDENFKLRAMTQARIISLDEALSPRQNVFL